jgi:hypothetical protein
MSRVHDELFKLQNLRRDGRMSFGGSFSQVGYATAGRSSFLRRRYARHPADEMFLADHHIIGRPQKRKSERERKKKTKMSTVRTNSPPLKHRRIIKRILNTQ